MGPHWAHLARAGAPPRWSRPSMAGQRAVLNGVPWILRTGAVGRSAGPLSVVSNVPPAVSAMGPLGVLRSVLEVLAQALHDEGYLDLQEAFIDGSFAPAKQGAPAWARRSAATGRRSWPSQIARVSLSPSTSRAPHRMKLD